MDLSAIERYYSRHVPTLQEARSEYAVLLPLLQKPLAALPGQGLPRRLTKLFLTALCNVVRSRRKKCGSTVVFRQHLSVQINEQKTFAHVLRHSGKFPHTLAQFVHLLTNGVLLLTQPLGQGLQFRVHFLGIIG